jgi:ketosteroid isomerase-like protein
MIYRNITEYPMKSLPLLTLMILLAACQQSAIKPQTDNSALARSLLEADQAFAALFEASDPKTAFAEYLAPDAIMIPRSGEPRPGYAQAVASFGDNPGFELLWQPQMAEVAAAGDMGWTWGRYQVRVENAQVSSGKYVNIWKMQPDGRWKVRLDLGNEEPQ